MTRKMFTRGDHSVVLQPSNDRRSHRGDERGVLTKRANANHRIRGIVVDVEHGGERDVHAERAPLSSCHAALLVGETGIACRAQGHLRRKDRRAAEIDVVGEEVSSALPHAGAVFVVSADDERQRTQALHHVELLGRVDR